MSSTPGTISQESSPAQAEWPEKVLALALECLKLDRQETLDDLSQEFSREVLGAPQFGVATPEKNQEAQLQSLLQAASQVLDPQPNPRELVKSVLNQPDPESRREAAYQAVRKGLGL